MYKLTFKRQAIKALRKMPSPPARRIRRELDESAENPEGRNLDVNALRGRRGFRLRVGEMRIIFERRRRRLYHRRAAHRSSGSGLQEIGGRHEQDASHF